MTPPEAAPAADRDLDELTGRQKAAIFCMLLGSEAAAEVTQHLDADEVEGISYEIARMEHVDAEIANAVLEEWEEMALATSSLARGGVDYAREVLEKAFGTRKAEAVLDRVENQLNDAAQLFGLRNADPQQLSSVLRNEHPQILALVLAHLDESQASKVLQQVDEETGGEVLYRMASMERVSPDMLEMVGESFGDEDELYMSDDMASAGGPETAAGVLNQIPSSAEKELLEVIDERDEELCGEIKNLMFVFEDLASVDERSLQRLMQEVETKELALALKVASEELKERLQSVMTKRARQSLEDEMEFLGPVRVSDVEDAQQRIVNQARALEESGEIVLSSGEEDRVIE